jgi:hypothetical protein
MNTALTRANGKRNVVRIHGRNVEAGVKNGLFRSGDSILDKGV